MKNLVTTILAGACLAAAIPSTVQAADLAKHDDGIEAMLSAAGFQAIPDTAPDVAQIVAIAPHRKLRAEPTGSEFSYVYVDTKGCGCVFEGDEAAYQRYRAIDLQHRTAELNSSVAFAPVPFGGWGWGWHAGFGYRPFGWGYHPWVYGGGWHHH